MSNAYGNIQAEDIAPKLLTDEMIAAEVDKCDAFINEIDSEQRYANTPGYLMTHGGRRAALIERREALTDEQKRRADDHYTVADAIARGRLLGFVEVMVMMTNDSAKGYPTDYAPDYARNLMKRLNALIQGEK